MRQVAPAKEAGPSHHGSMQIYEYFLKKSAELKTFLPTKLPRYVGKLAVDFFQDNFRRGGWQDGGLKRWQPHLQ